MTEPYHTPALVETVVKLLLTKPDGVYVDGTLGGGGHARAMLDVLSPGGKVIGIDQDADAVEHAQKELKVYGRRFAAVHERFSAIKDVLRRQSVDRIDGL